VAVDDATFIHIQIIFIKKKLISAAEIINMSEMLICAQPVDSYVSRLVKQSSLVE